MQQCQLPEMAIGCGGQMIYLKLVVLVTLWMSAESPSNCQNMSELLNTQIDPKIHPSDSSEAREGVSTSRKVTVNRNSAGDVAANRFVSIVKPVSSSARNKMI